MSTREELACSAAVWIVDHGLDYSSALRKAAEQHGVSSRRRSDWPDHLEVEAAVREHLGLFCADTHPRELRVLRELALTWMERLREFNPHVGGAVWRGTATRHSPILLDLYTDDPTAPEIALVNLGVRYESGQRTGQGREPVPVLGLQIPSADLQQVVPIEISVWPTDDLRGALRPDESGQTWRAHTQVLRQLLNS